MRLNVVRTGTVFFVWIGSVLLSACGEPTEVLPLYGTFPFLDSAVVLNIPDGALDYVPISQGSRARINPIQSFDALAAHSYYDHELLVAGSAYDLQPHGFQFSTPVSLSLRYDPSGLPETVLEAELRLREFVDGVWVELTSSSPDTTTNTVTGQITSLGTFGVVGVPVDGVTVVPATVAVEEGDTILLQTSVRDASGNELPLRSVSWSSSNISVAAVDSIGLVVGVAEGTAMITATCGGVSGAVSIIVTRAAVESVVIEPSALTLVVGAAQQLVATAKDANGNTLFRDVTWSTTNASIATVSSTGLVRAIAAGTTTIQATSEGRADTVVVTVQGPAVRYVQVAPPNATTTVGGTLQLTAVAKDAAYNPVPGATVVWSSDNESVATVAPHGLVTGIAVGTTNVTATVDGISDTAIITVIPAPVASVEVVPSNATVQVAATVQLSATLRDAVGNILSGRTVVWSSANESVATVGGGGLVIGIAVGNTTITATSEGQSGSASVTVDPASSWTGETLLSIDFNEYAVDQPPVPPQDSSYTWTVPPPPEVGTTLVRSAVGDLTNKPLELTTLAGAPDVARFSIASLEGPFDSGSYLTRWRIVVPTGAGVPSCHRVVVPNLAGASNASTVWIRFDLAGDGSFWLQGAGGQPIPTSVDVEPGVSLLVDVHHDLDQGTTAYWVNGELELEQNQPMLPMVIRDISLRSCSPTPTQVTESVAWDDIELIRVIP